MRKYGQYFIAAVIVLGSYQVNATIITLDDNNIRNTGIYIENNFKITAPVGLVNGKLNLAKSPHLSDNGFSGRYMETWNTEAVFSLEEASGKAFDFIGLDVGSYYDKIDKHLGLAAWTFTGFNSNSEVFSSVEPEFFGNLTLNWTNLTRVTIKSYRASAASAFDNIEVLVLPPVAVVSSLTAPISVNTPQSILLLTTALFFIGLRRRKITD